MDNSQIKKIKKILRGRWWCWNIRTWLDLTYYCIPCCAWHHDMTASTTTKTMVPIWKKKSIHSSRQIFLQSESTSLAIKKNLCHSKALLLLATKNKLFIFLITKITKRGPLNLFPGLSICFIVPFRNFSMNDGALMSVGKTSARWSGTMDEF